MTPGMNMMEGMGEQRPAGPRHRETKPSRVLSFRLLGVAQLCDVKHPKTLKV